MLSRYLELTDWDLLQINMNEKLDSLRRGIAEFVKSSGDETLQSDITQPDPRGRTEDCELWALRLFFSWPNTGVPTTRTKEDYLK